MFNKTRLLSSLILLCIGSAAFAQNVTSTPYSQFGLGQILKNNSVVLLGMGGISNGIRLENAINTQNPASYTSLQWTTFEVGAFGSFLELKSNSGKAFRNNAALSYLKIGFPVSKKWGTSFGLLPVSGMGYDSRVQAEFLDTPVTQVYSGSGGLNQFYIGNAYKINENLSIGLNVSYIFGTIERTKANEFPDSTAFLNIKQVNSTYIGSLFFNYGIQYKKLLTNDRYITIGLNGNPGTNLNAVRNTLGIRYLYQGNVERIVDTTQKTIEEKGKVYFPMINSLGFAYGRQNHWLVGADFTFGNWSNLELFGVKQSLKNTTEISLGASYTPDYMAVGNYFKNIEYRIGFNYNQSYVNILSENINQLNLSLGMALPLPKSASRVNLALELGKRGTTKSGLIEENYIGVHAGFNFCDKWFIQRKYD